MGCDLLRGPRGLGLPLFEPHESGPARCGRARTASRVSLGEVVRELCDSRRTTGYTIHPRMQQNLGPGAASRWSARNPVKGRNGRNYASCSSSATSSGRLFLDRVARQQSPSPLHRHPQINMRPPAFLAQGDVSTLPGTGHFYFCLDIAAQAKPIDRTMTA